MRIDILLSPRPDPTRPGPILPSHSSSSEGCRHCVCLRVHGCGGSFFLSDCAQAQDEGLQARCNRHGLQHRHWQVNLRFVCVCVFGWILGSAIAL